MRVKLKDLSFFIKEGFKFNKKHPEFIEKDDFILLTSMIGKTIEVVKCSELKSALDYNYNSVEFGFFIKKEFCEVIQ